MNYKLTISLSLLCIFSIDMQAGLRCGIIERFRGLPRKSKLALVTVIAKDFEIHKSIKNLEKNKKQMTEDELKAAKEKKYELYRERHDLIMKLDKPALEALYNNVYKNTIESSNIRHELKGLSAKHIESLNELRKLKYISILLEELLHK